VEGFIGYAFDDPVIKLDSIPSNCQLVCVGHFHAYQTKELQNSTIIYPGSTERASFQEENEEKGFAWIEVGKDGVVSKEHIKTSARPFKTIDTFFPSETDPLKVLKDILDQCRNPETVVRLRLRGHVPIERLSGYRRSELLIHGQDRFFHLAVDESELEIDSPEPIAALPRTTPLEELRRQFTLVLQGASDRERTILEEALKLCESKLEEAGAW
jgi:DNA repair exonuclease SbcCD nuclease subunit